MSNFTINKGMSNKFIITIKKNDTILPLVIDPTDTFKLLNALPIKSLKLVCLQGF